MDLNLLSSMRASICSNKQASCRYAFLFPIVLGDSKLTWKKVCKLRMAFSVHGEVIIDIDDIVLSHVRHVLHVVSIPSLIFDKSSGGLGLDLGYSFENLKLRLFKMPFWSVVVIMIPLLFSE